MSEHLPDNINSPFEYGLTVLNAELWNGLVTTTSDAEQQATREVLRGIMATQIISDAMGIMTGAPMVDPRDKSMPFRNNRLIRLRYGFEEGAQRPIGETATLFGITHARVQQIQNKRVERLRYRVLSHIYGEETEELVDKINKAKLL